MQTKKHLALVGSLICAQLLMLTQPLPTQAATDCPELMAGDAFKAESTSSVYLLNPQNKRAVFANADVFLSWYNDFSNVRTIPDECVALYEVGPPVPYRPGSRLVKGLSPDVYMIAPGSKLIKIENEEVAQELYGEQWNTKVRALEDFHFNSYVRTGDAHADKAPHDGMLIEQDGFVYYLENGLSHEVIEYPEELENLEIKKVEADQELPFPLSDDIVSFEEINKRNILDGSMTRLLGEQKIVNAMFEQSQKVVSARQKSVFYFDGLAEEEADLANDPLIQTLSSGRIVVDSKIDKQVCNSEKGHVKASFETRNENGTYNNVGAAEAITLGNGTTDNATAYFKMYNFEIPEAESSFIYEIILDKWIRFNAAEFEEQVSKSFDEADVDRDTLAGVANIGKLAVTPIMADECSSSALLDDSFSAPHLISVTENLGETTLNEVPVHHFAFTIDRSTLRKLLHESANTLDEDFDIDSFDSLDGLLGLLDEGMDIKDAEVWIGKQDLLPRKLTLTVVPFDEYTGEELGEITYEVEFSEFNSTFTIKAPEESVSLFEILEALVEALFSELDEEWMVPTEELIEEESALMPVDENRDHIYGPIDAQLTIIEYGDLECPFCATFHPSLKELVHHYDGDIRWVYRHYPLTSIHPRSEYLAHVSECAADQGKFWESLEAIFEDATKDVTSYARDLDISQSALSNCVQTKKHDAKIQADIANAKLLNVVGVPHTVIIDAFGNETVVEGAQSYAQMEELIVSLLAY